MTKFLETVNALKNKILVPINRIKCVNKTGQTSFSIEIVTDDGSVFEYHKSQEEQDDRYQEIKNILNGSIRECSFNCVSIKL